MDLVRNSPEPFASSATQKPPPPWTRRSWEDPGLRQANVRAHGHVTCPGGLCCGRARFFAIEDKPLSDFNLSQILLFYEERQAKHF